MNKEQRDFFISFKSEDIDWANWIDAQLKIYGYTTYFQEQDFKVGNDFMERMNTGISNSKKVIAIWTKKYFEGQYSFLEGCVALSQKKLIPIKIENFEIPVLFSTTIYIDLLNKTENEARKLLISRIKAIFSENRHGYLNELPKYPIDENNIKSESSVNIKNHLKVLYIGSKKSSSLDIEISKESILKIAKECENNKKIKFISNLNINTSNIFSIISKHKPDIVHFTGKQHGENIRIADKYGKITSISDVELCGILTSFENIKLAIIDTCKSYNCARYMSDVIDFTIGVKGDIYQEDSDIFFNLFYKHLFEGKSIKESSEFSSKKLLDKGVSLREIPTLLSKKNIDSSTSYFMNRN